MSSQEIAVIDTSALVPAEVFAPGGIEAILAKLEAEVRAVETDVSTERGRKAIASLAHKVARSKTALDDMGKELVAGIKATAAAIDADRRTVRDRLDLLKMEVRRPLDEFEAAEARRVEAHERGIAGIVAYGNTACSDAADLAILLQNLGMVDISGFEEFTARAERAKADAIARLEKLLAEARQREAEQAELARLRAAEAERQRLADLEKAKAEAADALRQDAERAQQRAKEAEARAAQAQADAERLANEAADRAVQQERDRQRREQEAAEREAQKRAADRENRARVHNAAAAALEAEGIDPASAKAAIIAIVAGRVPGVSIAF
jgi:hypothetical protein